MLDDSLKIKKPLNKLKWFLIIIEI